MNGRYKVFEAVNDRLREVYVGLSRQPMVDAIGLLRRDPPTAISHWSVADIDAIRSIEFDLTEAQARDYIRDYVRTRARPSWRYLTDATTRRASP